MKWLALTFGAIMLSLGFGLADQIIEARTVSKETLLMAQKITFGMRALTKQLHDFRLSMTRLS